MTDGFQLYGITEEGDSVAVLVDSLGRVLVSGAPAGPEGPPGPPGSDGAEGATGPTGAAGAGVPVGGSAGQVLAKVTGTDYDTEWTTPSGGGGGGGGGLSVIERAVGETIRDIPLSLAFGGSVGATTFPNSGTLPVMIRAVGSAAIVAATASPGGRAVRIPTGGSQVTIQGIAPMLEESRDFYVECFVTREDSGHFALFDLGQVGDDLARRSGLISYVDTTGQVRLWQNGGWIYTSPDAVAVGSRTHVRHEVTDGTARVYIDGTLSGSPFLFPRGLSAADMMIGRSLTDFTTGTALVDSFNWVHSVGLTPGTFDPAEQVAPSWLPADLPATPTAGTMATDGLSLYICTATTPDTVWKRSSLVPR